MNMTINDLSQDQRDQLAKLADLPDHKIDTSDIPEVPSDSWSQARRSIHVGRRQEKRRS
ncbi:hypothetical protein [Mesorhizobium huakuii]|uniref:Uncharacterized protein n=1 Tax=Mesorhizobium huakuii TaxID=28104 RepID=A0A7G6SRV9_9HYPH|nr:hypothetical protein [Mesorhizobium huakuii]QND57241.1 hypothetical protein HB778_11910 [Mesorhizobium huakuii]